MPSLTKTFGVIRVVILTVVTLFSALVLIMGALITNFTTSTLSGYFVYAAFAIAIAALTLVTVPVMLGLSINRKGAFTSMIVVELSYVALLWVLWLAVGGVIGNITWINYCSSLGYYAGYYYPGYESACMETQAMAAFAFLNWILLMALNIFLLSLAIMQANRGNSGIWTSCVTDVDYSAPGPDENTEAKVAYATTPVVTPMQVPMTTPINQYPQLVPSPQPQQAYPPQQMYATQQPVMPMAAQV